MVLKVFSNINCFLILQDSLKIKPPLSRGGLTILHWHFVSWPHCGMESFRQEGGGKTSANKKMKQPDADHREDKRMVWYQSSASPFIYIPGLAAWEVKPDDNLHFYGLQVSFSFSCKDSTTGTLQEGNIHHVPQQLRTCPCLFYLCSRLTGQSGL